MKKVNIILFVSLFLTMSLSAQRSQGRRFEKMLEKYKSERVAYLTDKLELTVSEAEKFWPVYNEYQEKRETAMRRSRPNLRRPNPDSLSVEQMESFMEAKIDADLKMAELAQQYHKKFVKTLGVKKVFQLYHAEQEFMSYMIRKMRPGDGSGSGHQRSGNRLTPENR